MISTIGNSLQILAILLAIMAIIRRSTVYGRSVFFSSNIVLISTFLLLVWEFCSSDFTLQNVFFYSSTITPLIFKIAASWASHEGSMLLWLSILSIINCLYVYHTPHRINQYQILLCAVLQLMFSGFIYYTSNPFQTLPFQAYEGTGLTPVLQDIALTVHPPMLYLGYLCYMPAFITASIILCTKDNAQLIDLVISLQAKIQPTKNDLAQLLKLTHKFTYFAVLATTCGIAIGGWWAYREFGWGGYWFFDPVENISLLPWLSGIALHHTMLITINSGKLLRWSLFLSKLTFLLVILGTFLVRSGLISSVHSFVNTSYIKGVILFMIFACMAIASAALLVLRLIKMPTLSPVIYDYKEIGIIGGNYFWLSGLIVLLISIVYPIIYSLWQKQEIAIGYQYFINSFIPCAIPTLILAAVFSGYSNCKTYFSAIAASIIAGVYSYSAYKNCTLIESCAITSAIFLIVRTIHILYSRSFKFTKLPTEKNIAMILSHFGFGLLVLSIAINSILKQEIDFVGRIGSTKQHSRFNVKLTNIKFTRGPNYYRQVAEFLIQDNVTNIVTLLSPENRLYIIENSLSQEVNIYSYLLYDLYAVLTNIDNGIIHAKIYFQPMINILWLSIYIIVGGVLIGMLSFSKEH